MQRSGTNVKKLATLAVLSAIAYVVMLFKVPVVLFLSYEAKDVIITIGGFIYGPLAAFSMSLVVSLVEMVTVSTTGPIGLIMNVISTCAFSCTAAYIYKKRRSMSGAAIGLVSAVIAMTAVMLLWNYIITPLYMQNVTRQDIAGMLIPIFLPFNLLKAGLNAAIAMLLYKPIVVGLRKARLVPESSGATAKKFNWGATLVALVVLATVILLLLVFMGII